MIDDTLDHVEHVLSSRSPTVEFGKSEYDP
jgi:hypothetical protein